MVRPHLAPPALLPSQPQPWPASASANNSQVGSFILDEECGEAPGGVQWSQWEERAGGDLSLRAVPVSTWHCPGLQLTSPLAPSPWAPCAPHSPGSRGPFPSPITGGLRSPLASPTDACLPVGVEHKLDVAAAAGTLLCVIACVLTATVTIVARHCAERAGGLSACFSLGTKFSRAQSLAFLSGCLSRAPFPSHLLLLRPHAHLTVPPSPAAIPGISHLQSRWFLVSSKPGRHSQAIPPLGVSRQM